MSAMIANLRENVKDNSRYCTLCGRVNKEVSVHLFPKDVSLKAKWAAYCSVETCEIKSKHSLCAKHFEPSCLKKSNDCTRLKLGSVPSVVVRNEIKERMKQHRYRSCVLCGGSLDPNLRYHRQVMELTEIYSFPRDVLNRTKWAAFCDMSIEHVKTGHKLCNKHFIPSCFDRKKKLLPNSIPTIFESTKNTEVEVSMPLAEHNYSFAFDSTVDKLEESTSMETELILQSAGSNSDILTYSATSRTPAQNLTNVANPKTCRRNIRYLGDLKSPDLKVVTPRHLRKFYSVVQQKLAGKTKVIRAAKQRERRMAYKLKNLQELVTKLKDKNKINADAAAYLVRFINGLTYTRF